MRRREVIAGLAGAAALPLVARAQQAVPVIGLIQREISDYLQLSQTAMGSTKMIADNIVLWKETAHSTARTREKRSAATERADFVAPAPLPSPSPTAAKDLFIPPK